MFPMKELFSFPGVWDRWPEGVNHGQCRLLVRRLGADEPFVHHWFDGAFIVKGRLSIMASIPRKIPNGVYRLLAIRYFEQGKSEQFLATTFPYDGKIDAFHLIGGQMFVPVEQSELDRLDMEWVEKVSIGDRSNQTEGRLHSEAHFLCSDCLITSPIRIGPAEIFPLGRERSLDLASAVREMVLQQGIRDQDVSMFSGHLNSQDDRLSPLFSVCFRRYYYSEEPRITDLIPYLNRIFGLLSVNRGSYAKYLSCLLIDQFDGHKNVKTINLNSYYRGNLVGGSISGENPRKLNRQYKVAEASAFITEILSKLNSARDEMDLDVAYFRFWSILEAITVHVMALNRRPKVGEVREVIRQSYESHANMEAVSLELGEESFSFEELTVMWYAWRSLTAHYGGLELAKSVGAKIDGGNTRLLKEMVRLSFPVMFGEDRSLIVLASTTDKVVQALVAKTILPPS